MSAHSPLRFKNRLYYALLAAGGLVVLAGLYAVYLMEHHGHIITGMDNQIVWGMPHVFAIFLIVAASGVLNVASIGSVFGKADYKARAPLAGLLSIAMLAREKKIPCLVVAAGNAREAAGGKQCVVQAVFGVQW